MEPKDTPVAMSGLALARLCVRYAIPAAAAFVVLGGTFAYLRCNPESHWTDALYGALALFVVSVGQCGAAIGSGEWIVFNLARFLAFVLVFLAILRIFFEPLSRWLKLATQALLFSKKRHVLIGFGALNREIARELARRGYPLTIVSRDIDSAARDFAATTRAVLLARDVRDAGALDSLRLTRARRIIIACGDDSLTLELAQHIGRIWHRAHGRPMGDRPSGRHAEARLATETIYAHFMSPEMHRQVMRSRDMGLGHERRFSGFCIREDTARYLMARSWLVERAVLAGDPRVHVALVGAGDLGLAIAREALQHGCSAGRDVAGEGKAEASDPSLAPPRLTVIDKDAGASESRFRAAMPRLFDDTIPQEDRPEFAFASCAAEELRVSWTACGEAGEPSLDAGDMTDHTEVPDPAEADAAVRAADSGVWRAVAKGGRVTAWILCCPEDAQNLTLAMKLESGMRRGLIPPAPIFARQWLGNVQDSVQSTLGQSDPLHLAIPFGGMHEVVGTLEFLDETYLQLAMAIHAEYDTAVRDAAKGTSYGAALDEYGPPPWAEGAGPADPAARHAVETRYREDQKRFRGNWETLNDEGRLSNLAPARQASVRLWEMGFDWKGRHAGVLPFVQPFQAARLKAEVEAGGLDTAKRFGQIARAEHRRWMVERALRGWTRGARDSGLRLHPNFQPYDSLRSAYRAHLEASLGDGAQAGEAAGAEEDMRLYDASVAIGILRQLSQHAGSGKAGAIAWRPGAAGQTSLFDGRPIADGVADLAVSLPAVKPAGVIAEDAIAPILRWLELSTSVTLRLVPERPGVLDAISPEVNAAVSRLHAIATERRVHVTLDLPDGRAHRQSLTRGL